jgi:hypothetical protein
MDHAKTTPDEEISATSAVYKALAALDSEARTRVVSHVTAMLEMPAFVTKPKAAKDHQTLDDESDGPDIKATSLATYATFAELFDAAQPQTMGRKALVAGYWLQVCQGAESFDGQSANKELNHLGHRIPNITNAIGSLNAEKPALAIQLKKSGSSQQARKTYKITAAGIAAVKAMLNG